MASMGKVIRGGDGGGDGRSPPPQLLWSRMSDAASRGGIDTLATADRKTPGWARGSQRIPGAATKTLRRKDVGRLLGEWHTGVYSRGGDGVRGLASFDELLRLNYPKASRAEVPSLGARRLVVYIPRRAHAPHRVPPTDGGVGTGAEAARTDQCAEGGAGVDRRGPIHSRQALRAARHRPERHARCGRVHAGTAARPAPRAQAAGERAGGVVSSRDEHAAVALRPPRVRPCVRSLWAQLASGGGLDASEMRGIFQERDIDENGVLDVPEVSRILPPVPLLPSSLPL
eukprot:3084014-Prymnesium_polylepis.1